MNSLVFPAELTPDPEPSSYDNLDSVATNTNPIPIDPALHETPIDPALMLEGDSINVLQPQPQDSYFPQSTSPLEDDYQTRQYSQGPQGDPFAPQILTPFFPPPQEDHPPPHKTKRKRKTQRFEGCRTCQNTAKPETMITCNDCGRKDHPMCLKLDNLADVVRSYPWKCTECKSCEICNRKGDDEAMVFCDSCDRGWHLYCMNPALKDPPEGEWHCPTCVRNPPVILGPMPPMLPFDQLPLDQPYIQQDQDIDIMHLPDEHLRESSVASTSRSVAEPPAAPVISARGGRGGRGGRRGRGKARVQVVTHKSDNDEMEEGPQHVRVEEEEQEEEEEVVIPRPARRGRAPKFAKTRMARVPTPSSDGDRAPSPVARPMKRKRVVREPSPPAPPLPRVRLRLPPQRGKGKEREVDEEAEAPHGLFDEILSVEDRDTTKTTIGNHDKLLFERSRIAAEARLAPAPPPPPPSATASSSRRGESYLDVISPTATTSTARPLRSATLQHLQTNTSSIADLANSPAPSTPGAHGHPHPHQLPKFDPGVLRIRTIRFGPFDITTWYDAPFPEEYATIPDGRLWICEFCLKYMKSRFGAIRHQKKCKARHPPGDEIYRDGDISIFEVDGRRNKIYCQNLCLLSKMFLDHKSLFYDVEPFLFYVITKVDEFGARFVGYFSKEKRCSKDYNLSCIMTLPVRQRQGWGNLLIDFSYLLSKVEQRVGSPEKPLSGLGALGYKNYWTLAVMRFLATAPDRVRLEEISSATSMTMEDVCNTLIQQNMIFIREPTPPSVRPSPGQSIRHFKGRRGNPPRKQMQRMQSHQLQYLDNKANGSEGKGPFVPPQHYEIRFDRAKVNTFLDKWESKGYLKLKPDKLQWTPYKVTRKEEILPTVPLVNFNRTNNANVDVEEQKHAGGIMEDGSGGDTTASVNGRTTVEPMTPARRGGDDDDNDDAMNVDGSNRDDEQDMLPDLTTPRTTRRQASLRSPAKSKGSAKQGRTETPSISLRSRRGVGSTPVQKQEEEEGAVVEESTPPPDPPKKRKGRPPLPPSEKERRRLERQQKNLASISPAINGARKPRTRGNIINSSPIIEVEESISTRSTRRGRRSMKTVAISDAESSSDEEEGESAVAEALGERQLRSRRSDEGSAVPTPPRPSLVRNRSRVVTSPLEEEEEEEEVEEPTQPEHDNDVEDEDAEGDEDVPADELPNVHAVNGDVESTDMVVDSPEVNGIDQAEETDRQSTKTPETTEQVGIAVYTKDIKAEDVGTPLTILMSRQSVPSDDTVFAVNGDGMSSKYVGFVSSQAEVHGPQHAESDLRSTLESELDDCHDEDADGEDDVDASGEDETEIMAF